MKNIKIGSIRLEAVKPLGREDLRKITGGVFACKPLGAPCQSDIECCINYCMFTGGPSYGICAPRT